MNIHVKLALGLVTLAAIASAAYKYVWPRFETARQISSTDARATKGHIRIGMDNWIGYFPLCSQEMKTRMRVAGYVLHCDDDKADYPKRFERLKSGELQFAVSTVDAYLSNGAASGFPGAIVAVLDESKGGDALVAWKDKVASIESLKAAQTPRVAFTPGSPSEHLLRATGVHFDVPALRSPKGPWRLETTGSSDALKALLDKRSDAAVLWEPDVSRALATPGVVRLLSTADTQRLIVDVLLARSATVQSNPEMVQALINTYFEVLRHYRDQPALLAKDVATETRAAAPQVNAMLAGVAWASLSDNARLWLGGSYIVSPNGGQMSGPAASGAVDVIQSTLRVLLDSAALPSNPLPAQDPYRITSSQFIAAAYNAAQLAAAGAGQAEAAASAAGTGLERRFTALSDAQWAQVQEVGTLKSLQVGFQSGAIELNLEGKAELDRLMEVLRHYPTFRIRVLGHTGQAGEADANQRLSQDRADAVARYLGVTYNVDPNRVRVQGLGAARPLPRAEGESDRAYQYRLPRVEIALVGEAL